MTKFKIGNFPAKAGSRKMRGKFKIATVSFELCVFLCVCSLILPDICLAATVLPFAAASDVTVSMDFKDISLKDFLKIFSIQSGLNFIASEAVQDRKITLYLDKVPVKEAAEQLFKANNLTYEYDPVSNIILVKDWGKPEVETITKIFSLKYASVSTSSLSNELYQYVIQGKDEIKAGEGGGTGGGAGGAGGGSGRWKSETEAGITYVVKSLLSDNGSLIEDARTNSLIVTDMPSRMPIIEAVIKQLDVPQPQVLLEVEVLDVSKNALDAMGMKFGQTPFQVTFTGATRDIGFPFKSWAKTFPTANVGSVTIGPGDDYNWTFDYLSTLTDTKSLARPRVLTLNNETAEIKISTYEVIGEKETQEGTGTDVRITREAERYETGVSLRITPQVNAQTGEITMFIFPKVTEANTSTFSEAYRDPEQRGTKSVVKVRDGQTIILGGLIRHQKNVTETKLPILGDIPFLGKLVTHKDRDKDLERELLVFITPHIVKEPKVRLAGASFQKAKMQREQDSIFLNKRLNSIEAALDKLEKKKTK